MHRADLKRLFAVHDTPWTQAAVIRGLLHLFRRSGDERWLARALPLADAQVARQSPDGSFCGAGHEDDRFSSLVHNALADCALIEIAAASGDDAYLVAAERNLRDYVVGALYRDALQGFAVAPVDHYAGRDRFVLNMNAVAIEALAALDRAREDDRHAELTRRVGTRLLELCGDDGPPYSDLESRTYVPLYTGLTLRGLRHVRGSEAAVRAAVAFLERMEDAATGLWFHKLERGTPVRNPVFVAGAGTICNGLLDVGVEVDPGRLLRHQQPTGAIRNFVGYDSPGNGRARGRGGEAWEDVFPTPNWNAQAFEFLCRVLPVPQSGPRERVRRTISPSRRYVYVETDRIAAVAGKRGLAALYLKRTRYGLVVPSPYAVARWLTRLR